MLKTTRSTIVKAIQLTLMDLISGGLNSSVFAQVEEIKSGGNYVRWTSKV